MDVHSAVREWCRALNPKHRVLASLRAVEELDLASRSSGRLHVNPLIANRKPSFFQICYTGVFLRVINCVSRKL